MGRAHALELVRVNRRASGASRVICGLPATLKSDVWLIESFANSISYRIGNERCPELGIGVGAIVENFGAMNINSLKVVYSIHQPIIDNSQIDATFDTIA